MHGGNSYGQLWPNHLWPKPSLAKPSLAKSKFGQTIFGQIDQNYCFCVFNDQNWCFNILKFSNVFFFLLILFCFSCTFSLSFSSFSSFIFIFLYFFFSWGPGQTCERGTPFTCSLAGCAPEMTPEKTLAHVCREARDKHHNGSKRRMVHRYGRVKPPARPQNPGRQKTESVRRHDQKKTQNCAELLVGDRCLLARIT